MAPPPSKQLMFAVLLMMATWARLGNAAPESAPAPSSDCEEAVYDLQDCLEYVIEGSSQTEPDDGCCTGMVSVEKKYPDCFCAAFETAYYLNLTLNMTRVLSLPQDCYLAPHPIDNCTGGFPLEAAPVPSFPPEISPTPTPTPTPTPIISPPPSARGDSTHSSARKLSAPLILVLQAATVFVVATKLL